MKKKITTFMSNKFLLILLFFLFGLVGNALSSDAAYIYSTDPTNAYSYQTVLNSIGWQTTLIEMADVATTDFSPYDIILIGSNSGHTTDWGDATSVNAIVNSNKPILGFGEGGYAFFGKLSLNIGYANGGHGSGDNMFVVQPNHTIFNSPNSITIPGDSVIQLYSTTSPQVNIYVPSAIPEVTLLGRVPTLPHHYLILQEQTQYFLWGFDDSPSSMTQTGTDLFKNIIVYISNISSTEDEINQAPKHFRIFQNYPNPFNPTTKIRFTISEVRYTTLKVYDVLGKEVFTLVNEEKPVGSYKIEFNAADLPSGVYFYQLKAGDFIETKKMILLR